MKILQTRQGDHKRLGTSKFTSIWLFACLNFGVMMDPLLEVLLARQLLHFSFKFHDLFLMISVLHLYN